jgi:hypothetical protein
MNNLNNLTFAIPAGMNEYEIVLRSPEGVILWEKFSHRERCEKAILELVQAYGLKLDEQEGGKIQLEISWM